MGKYLDGVRGMKDILPAATAAWRDLESIVTEILMVYGYEEIRLPLIEQTAVFQRSIGDATDIVQKEMYSFDDRNGDSLSLRPEGTASCVRAALEHNLLQQVPRRMWYLGPMFRHERPQRGRQRQFHQIGAEVFGAAGPDIDCEIILLTAQFWRALGLTKLRLELNSLGDGASRAGYRDALVEYFSANTDQLDNDSRTRLELNPLRILDSKNPDMAELIASAPSLLDYLDDESKAHFDWLQSNLSDNGIDFVVNPRLVRGLDYYSKTVFEWITEELGAQGTICAGGRYDGLVELMGGKPTPAIGFAMGLERLIELREVQQGQVSQTASDIYILAANEALNSHALALAEDLRRQRPHWRVTLHVGGGSLKSRFKKADRSGAGFALILGEQEVSDNSVSIKSLRSEDPQITTARGACVAELEKRLES